MMRFVLRPEYSTPQWPFRFTMTNESLGHPRANSNWDEVRKWITANVMGPCAADFAAGIFLDRESDAFAFRMRWC